MLSLDELRLQRELVNQIDWSMTPEKAVDMYLEWGAGWARGNDFVRGEGDISIYFVIYEWERPFQATLLKRSSRDVEEIAKISIDHDTAQESFSEFGKKAGVGVYPLTYKLKRQLSELLDGPPVAIEQ
ncbi:MAG: hypothetical protein M0022_09410 [Desulfobacteraceae bacterium]|nr:hypothetical protein [Desulfobacteraceae bacterium]